MDDITLEPHYAFFRDMPWCARLFSDPEFRILHYDRDPKPDTEDSFIAETLKTPLGIYAAMAFASVPTGSPPMPVPEVRVLFALGSGLNGHAHIAHGGFLVTLFDEAQGLLLASNRDLQPEGMERPSCFTATMKVDYLVPVKTQQVVMARAWLRAASGRKYFIDSTLEDGEGRVLARGEGLWIGTAAIQGTAKL
jgi:acyl-coenzyme A thioesterase THEM4